MSPIVSSKRLGKEGKHIPIWCLLFARCHVKLFLGGYCVCSLPQPCEESAVAGKYSGHGYNPGLAKPLHFSSLSL